jgi:hypothetical protein
MDSIPSYEFHAIFERTSQAIDLKGKYTEEEIEEELIRVRNKCKRLAEQAETRKKQAIYNSKKVAIEKLVEYGFPRRVIIEAQRDPKGKVALTLQCGYREAKRRLLAQARTKMRVAVRRRNRRLLP